MDGRTRRGSRLGPVPFCLVILLVTSAGAARGQQLDLAPIGEEKLTAFAEAFLEIASVRDEFHALLAHPANKNAEAQANLRQEMRDRISQVLQDHELAEEEYEQITFVLSVDGEQRKVFDAILARLEDGLTNP